MLPAMLFGLLIVLDAARARRRRLGHVRDRRSLLRFGPRRGRAQPHARAIQRPGRPPAADSSSARGVGGRRRRARSELSSGDPRSARERCRNQLRQPLHAGHVVDVTPCGGGGLAQGLAFGVMNTAWALGEVVGPSAGGALADSTAMRRPISSAPLSARSRSQRPIASPGGTTLMRRERDRDSSDASSRARRPIARRLKSAGKRSRTQRRRARRVDSRAVDEGEVRRLADAHREVLASTGSDGCGDR